MDHENDNQGCKQPPFARAPGSAWELWRGLMAGYYAATRSAGHGRAESIRNGAWLATRCLWDNRAERLPKVRLLVAWYDLWVGVFVDTAKRRLYVFPVPCVGLVIEWPATPANGSSPNG